VRRGERGERKGVERREGREKGCGEERGERERVWRGEGGERMGEERRGRREKDIKSDR